MSDIDAMQGRIMAALDRIGQGLDALSQGTDDTELEGLRQQLEDEKLANAQLEERVKQLGARTREAEEAARAAIEASNTEASGREAAQKDRTAAMARLDSELQSLRHANQQLRDNNAALRAANAEGVAQPHLINKAMMAELDGLRAARAADRSEMDALLVELGQITNGAARSDAARMEEG
jgi:chromosome segregation ATPase